LSKSNLVHVGTFGSPIGLKGEIKVKMLTSSFEFFKMLKVYLNEDASETWNFIKMRILNNKLIVHPQDCNNRDDAEKFRGKKIFSQSSNFPKTNKGEYYFKDLIGCSIFMLNGKKIGNVVSVENFGASDLLETKINNKTFYIPMNKDNLISVDLDKKKIMNIAKDSIIREKIKEDELLKYYDLNVKNKLQTDVNFRRVENVGPKVSAELLKSGLLAIALALGAMLFYIWVRFEWQFSIGSILAIFHDVLITIGLFSLLSLEINLSIVAAVLTIVGYSMNDTVVIYDRIRENLSKFSSSKIEEITNTSINETLSRTIITSLTTLLALISIFVLGGEILRGFALAMIIGVIIGTYSSIFVASPILKYLNVSYKTIAKDQENN